MNQPIQPQQLIDALTANGFTARNEGEDAFGPRGWTVWYPQRIDPTIRITAAPHTVGHALAELARAADTGRRATAVLASLTLQQPETADQGILDSSGAPAPDSGPTPRAQSSDEDAVDLDAVWARSEAYQGLWDGFVGEPGQSRIKAVCDSADDVRPLHDEVARLRDELAQAQWLRENADKVCDNAVAATREIAKQRDEVMDGWDIALPYLRDGALTEHHAKCGESSQWDIRRCEDAHCTERARLLEKFGMLPKEWGAYLAAPAGLDLSPAVERITAIAPGVDPSSDTWLPAEVIAPSDDLALVDPAANAIAGWRHAGGHHGPEGTREISDAEREAFARVQHMLVPRDPNERQPHISDFGRTPVQLCSDKAGPHGDHYWRPDPSGGLVECPGIPWTPKTEATR